MAKLAAVVDVFDLLDHRCQRLEAESIAPMVGRVLAEAVTSTVNVPAFARSAMDGYAVRAGDTATVGELRIVGQSRPGRSFTGVVGSREAVSITTGAAIPEGADAIVMIEHTETRGGSVVVKEPVAIGRHIIRIGEDVAAGCVVLPAWRALRPQDVGLLAAIGVRQIRVVRQPQVSILATGSELLPPGSTPTGSQIVDSNSPMLSALVGRDGGVVAAVRYVADNLNEMRIAIAEAASASDMLLVTGGSSVGSEDHAAAAVVSLGELPVHGIAIRPAKPSGVGFLPQPVFLLPGNPIACLCAYDLFASRGIRRLGGRAWELPYRRALLPLAEAFHSLRGRVDHARVKVVDEQVQVIAVGGASSLSSAVAADGFVIVAASRERINAGEMVEVWFYD